MPCESPVHRGVFVGKASVSQGESHFGDQRVDLSISIDHWGGFRNWGVLSGLFFAIKRVSSFFEVLKFERFASYI